MKLYLKPVGFGAENLNLINVEDEEGWTVILGRNVLTGLDSPCENIQYVSRSHVQVTVKRNEVYLSIVTKQKGVVYLNEKVLTQDEIKLKNGDIISMLGSLNYFNYELVDEEALRSYGFDENQSGKKLKRSNSNREPNKTVEIAMINLIDPPAQPEVKSISRPTSQTNLAPAPATDAASSHAVISKLIRQYECSICYETMACAYSLSPCGDSFCYSCISDWSQKNHTCPMCQIPFKMGNSMLNKIVDNAIREILGTDQEMLKEWEERVSTGLNAWKSSLTGSSSSTAVNSSAVGSSSARSNAASSGKSSGPIILDLFDTVGSSSKKSNSNKRSRDNNSSSNAVVDLTDSQPSSYSINRYFKTGS